MRPRGPTCTCYRVERGGRIRRGRFRHEPYYRHHIIRKHCAVLQPKTAQCLSNAGHVEFLHVATQHVPHLPPLAQPAFVHTLCRALCSAHERCTTCALTLTHRHTHAHTLLRRGDSTHQVGASRQERLDHVRDAFWVSPERVSALRGQRVVLVDDVMTTVASMYEAARALQAAGAGHIKGLGWLVPKSGKRFTDVPFNRFDAWQ